jgi:hypothetical protein
MQLPQWLAQFNRYFTNPIQRMGASHGHPRAHRPKVGQAVPDTVDGVQHR